MRDFFLALYLKRFSVSEVFTWWFPKTRYSDKCESWGFHGGKDRICDFICCYAV